ncbi:MAG: hypothetical protein Q9225_004023 [Loekoesia sp. 1 TL-2023]
MTPGQIYWRLVLELALPAFERTGSSGLDADVLDRQDLDNHAISVFMSTAAIWAPPTFNGPVVIVLGLSKPPDTLLKTLKKSSAKATGLMPEVKSVDEVKPADKVYLVLADIDEAFLMDTEAARYNTIQGFISGAKLHVCVKARVSRPTLGQEAWVKLPLCSQNISAQRSSPRSLQRRRNSFLVDTYGISPDCILSSRDPSFSKGIMSATGVRGVDVVLNSLSGQMLQESWNCVTYLGRFVEIGKRDIQTNKFLQMENFQKAISFAAVDLIQLATYNRSAPAKVMEQVSHLMAQGNTRTIKPITVYPISEVHRAFRTKQAGKTFGEDCPCATFR